MIHAAGVSGRFTTYRKQVGNALAYKHFAPSGAGRTTRAAGLARMWVDQGRVGALVVPLKGMVSFYATSFDLPKGYCLGGLPALAKHARDYHGLAIDGCEKFPASEGDPVEIALSALSGEEGPVRVVHGFYRSEPGALVVLAEGWELVDPDANPLRLVVPCEWASNGGLPPEWFLGHYGSTEEALRLVRLERVRQVSKEGFTPEHDDQYADGELMGAAICYLLAAVLQNAGLQAHRQPPEGWPWPPEWWKPAGGAQRCLEKAGGLMLAELERRARAEAATDGLG